MPLAILMGVVAYSIYAHCSLFNFMRPWSAQAVSIVQPVLIFTMLFLSFCKIDARRLRPRYWHLVMLLLQCGLFVLSGVVLYLCPDMPGRVILESAALCIISPTATAAAVVTRKLAGDEGDVTMYTILVNMAVAFVVPLTVPMIHPQADQHFWHSFLLILGRVFPMLICPLIAAQLVRTFLPRWISFLTASRDLPFYLWAVSLSIAIAVTARSLFHTTHAFVELSLIAVISLITCVLQFYVGRKIGQRCAHPISCSQGLGQKNTVFAIWMGYTFLNPATSLAGGFYSVWHNLYNTYQIRRKEQADGRQSKVEHGSLSSPRKGDNHPK